MTPFFHPSGSFLRKHTHTHKKRANGLKASTSAVSVSSISSGPFPLTSLNNRPQICEARGCSSQSSLLSRYLLRFKCRPFTFGPRWTAGYRPASCSQCDIQTQQIRCPLTAASSHQASNLSGSASVMIHTPAAFGAGTARLVWSFVFRLIPSFLSINLGNHKHASWVVILLYLPVVSVRRPIYHLCCHEVIPHTQKGSASKPLGPACTPLRLMNPRSMRQSRGRVLCSSAFKRLLLLTVGEGDLDGLGGVSEVPHRQAAVWVAAHELFPLVVPANWMDRLH